MVNKQFLIENNLLEVYNKFMHLCNETTYFSGNLEEEGEDDNNQQPQDQMQPPMDNQAPQGEQDMNSGMGGDTPKPEGAQGADPSLDPMQQPPMDGQQQNDANTEMGVTSPDMNMLPMDEPPMEETEEDDVIDVDDITNAQEKTNSKVNKVGRNLGKVDDKLMSLIDIIKNLQGMIDSNNAKIDAFAAEFERRNPTPTEKLNLRALDSYPFNTNPKEFWEKKASQPQVSGKRYEAYADNEEPVAKQEYVITQDDVNDYTQNSIRDSFHLSDDLRSTIEKIFDI